MKVNYKYFLGIALIAFIFSCKKSLDINTNPNTATKASVDLVLPTAIVSTANSIPAYSSMGAQQVGYFSNGGGISGWGGIISYNWNTGDFSGLWATTYDVLEDVEYVITNSDGKADQKDFNAAGKVLKAYNYALLVDTYNDVPYTEALKGNDKLQPSYDKAADVYKNLGDLLDQAVASFKGVGSKGSALFAKSDPLFKGDLSRWAKFAQTIKLRLMLRSVGKVTFAKTSFDTGIGFLEEDAIVNPGYTKIDGKQNPMWSRWAFDASGAAAGGGSQYAVTGYILGFYNGNKLDDQARANAVYQSGIAIPTNQLGNLSADAGRGASPSSFFVGNSVDDFNKIGVLKGFDSGQPLMLASESYFLQAEGNVKGLVAGDAQTNFDKGIKYSFKYLYKDNSNTVPADRDYAGDADTYHKDNIASPLVNFSAATTMDLKMEAIITQKYIASNMLFGHESWNEFRRTGYPKIVLAASPDKTKSFVSIASQSTAPDKLPTRIQYPASEFKYNASNVPTVTVYSSKIFWAK